MKEFVERFGTSRERCEILWGLLEYRANLMACGLTGFQWLSGSFVENVEFIRGRPPKDIDVISVINRPKSIESENQWEDFLDGENGVLITDAQAMKKAFHCDAYVIDMNEPVIDIVNLTRYWFGLFSHQRATSAWKGMVSVELNLQQDAEAAIIMPLMETVTNF